MVLRGEPGIGKSALLKYAAERAEGCRVLRAVGVEWELELPFASLHQLCVGLLEGRAWLPTPQAEALATAFGLSSGPQPDRFLLAVESVVLLFAEREPSRLEELAGLPELRVGGLDDSSARELLASVLTAPLDERVRARILAETRGKPLALLELPREFSAEGLAGGFGLPRDGSLPGRIEASFRRRVQQLPTETQRLLLLAAADPTGEPALLVRASEVISVPIHKLAPAEADGLLDLGVQVTFRHPLLRSAIYCAAASDGRRAAHRALAAATDPEFDSDRRAWHRAHAIAGPDEDVARELETSTLIFGARVAVLVDALATVREATALADWVALHDRRLTTIYITHGHGTTSACPCSSSAFPARGRWLPPEPRSRCASRPPRKH